MKIPGIPCFKQFLSSYSLALPFSVVSHECGNKIRVPVPRNGRSTTEAGRHGIKKDSSD